MVELTVGETYTLRDETPVCPKVHPKSKRDALKCIAAIERVPAGSKMKVLKRCSKQGVPWYRVQVTTHSGDVFGFVNSWALVKQGFVNGCTKPTSPQ